jgi:heme exporter protein B
MFLVESITIIIYFLLFDKINLDFIVFVIVGTIAFVSSGTLISAIASNTRSSSLMMPVLFFPVLVPVIISAVSGSQRAFDLGIISAFDELKLLLSYSIIFVALGYLSFDYIVEE